MARKRFLKAFKSRPPAPGLQNFSPIPTEMLLLSLLIASVEMASSAYPFGACPDGFFADGSCAILHLCIDPHERCMSGVCCEPADMFPSMPYGYNFGMPLPASHFGPIGQELIPPRACMDFEESCLHFAQYCNLPAVAEVCMRSCGLCHGMGGLGGGLPYAPYGGIWAGGK